MLALIAGTGHLPALIAAAQRQPPLVCGLEGFAPDGLASDLTFRLETLGTLLAELQRRGVREICLAGAIRRPEIEAARVDGATRALIPRLKDAMGKGDDGALRAVISIFEEAGLRVRGAGELAPDLLPPAGTLSVRTAGPAAEKDARRAEEIIAALDAADIGQGCAVLEGQALALEGVFGTDWMLDSLSHRPDGVGGLLFKCPKASQDRRADLPTIGPDTADRAAAAGLDGIVVEAGGVLLLNRAELIDRCNALGLYLWVRERTR